MLEIICCFDQADAGWRINSFISLPEYCPLLEGSAKMVALGVSCIDRSFPFLSPYFISIFFPFIRVLSMAFTVGGRKVHQIQKLYSLGESPN